jgi:hypothetical protein
MSEIIKFEELKRAMIDGATRPGTPTRQNCSGDDAESFLYALAPQPQV